MKKAFCLLFILSFCLSLFACGSSAPQGSPAATTPPPASSPVGTFPPELLTQLNAVPSDDLMSECGDLAVTGDLVWRCTNGQILCENPATSEIAASLPVSELLAEGESADYQGIASWRADTVLLLLAVPDASGHKRVELLELGLKEGGVAVLRKQSAEKELGFLFTGEDDWLEIDMVSNGQRLVFAALDPEFRLFFYLYDPQADALRSLGERTLSEYRAMYPYGEDMLILEPDEEEGTILNFTRLSLADGAVERVGRTKMDSLEISYNFVCDSTEDLLYFTVNNLLYAVKMHGGETAAPIGGLDGAPSSFRLGALAAGRFVCHDMQGQLLSCETHGDFAVTALRIADPLGMDLLSEAALGFGLAHPEYAVTVTESMEDDTLVSQLRNDPTVYDAFVVQLYSEDWNGLREGGYVAPLSDSRLFSAVFADMPSRMRSALDADGSLLAFPISVENYCPMLNTPAMEALTGVSRDKLPTDWPGLLKLLKKVANSGDLMKNDQYVLCPGGLTVEQFRELLLYDIMQDYVLQVGENATRSDNLQTLLPALKAFNEVDWTSMGLTPDIYDYEGDYLGSSDLAVSEAASGAQESVAFSADGIAAGSGKDSESSMPMYSYDSGTPVFTDAFLDIGVMDVEDGAEFWPLSISEGRERLVAQSIIVLCVNAHSPHREALFNYLEYLWGTMDLSTKMLLCQSVNEELPNTEYENDLAYFESQIKTLEQAAATEKKPAEKEILRAQLKELRAYTDRYRKNAKWAVDKHSIAVYRAFQDSMVPVGGMFWNNPSTMSILFDFLDMQITPKEFIKQLGSP